MTETEHTRFLTDNFENDTLLDAAPHDPQGARRWVVTRQSHVWRPPTDVFELEDRLVVMVEIGGMRDGEFSVVLQDRRLTISGVRRRAAHEQLAFHQMEVRYGEFRTEISLPWPVQRTGVSATYREGFLKVELPHAPNQQIQIVDVDIEQEETDV
ncbi:MAG: Hsp20/alpha crystallin family protein [Chloroflexota bacterium]